MIYSKIMVSTICGKRTVCHPANKQPKLQQKDTKHAAKLKRKNEHIVHITSKRKLLYRIRTNCTEQQTPNTQHNKQALQKNFRSTERT